jgi:hypothetical protein
MVRVPDVFGNSSFPGDKSGVYIPPSDNGQVLWRRMEDQSSQERKKHHDEWDRAAKDRKKGN